MQIDVQTIVRPHLQGGLHTRRRENKLGGIHRHRLIHQAADFGQTGLSIVVLLSVIVTGNPESGMVPCHSKLGMLLFDRKTVQTSLQRELITESQTVIIKAETDDDMTVLFLLFQPHSQLVVMIPYLCHFAPHGFPGFIKC